MDTNNIDLDLVRAYVNGSLSEDRLHDLQQRLNEDSEFASEFQLQVELVESVVQYNRGLLKQQLSAEDHDDAKIRSLDTTKPRAWWLAAASLVFVAIASYFLFWNQPNSDLLFDEYYQPYYNILSENQRSGDSAFSSIAMRWYDQGNYDKALTALDQIVTDERDQLTDFYRGICLIELDQHQQAELVFSRLAQMADFELQAAAQWYLGMSKLKAGSLASAKEIFQTISASPGPYQKRAQQIAEQL